MKALIYVLAIVLMAVGAAVALISFFSPGQVVLGLNLGLAATLIAGGVVTLGLAGVITALEDLARRLARLPASTAGKGGAGTAEPGAVETGMPSSERMAAVLGGGAALTAATAGAAIAATEEAEEPAEAAEEQAPAEREIFISPRAEAEDVIKAAEAVAPEAVETTEETSEDEEAEAEAEADEAGEEAEEEADEKKPPRKKPTRKKPTRKKPTRKKPKRRKRVPPRRLKPLRKPAKRLVRKPAKRLAKKKWTLRAFMWWRSASSAAVPRACFPTARWRPRPTRAGCVSRILNIWKNTWRP